MNHEYIDTAAPVSAAFMRNQRGMVCIAFDDPAWVQSEAILLDQKTGAIHALMHQGAHFLGNVTDEMSAAFAARREALLTAVRADGTIFEMMAPVQAKGAVT